MVIFRTLRSVRLFQALVCLVAFSLAWLQVSPSYGMAVSLRRETARREAWHLAHLPHVQLPAGLTQTPDAALQKKIAAKEAAQTQKPKPAPDVRPLSAAEMGQALGRGPLRNPYFAGAPMPWHRSLRDVNLSTGNLFKSFTDVQVAPARGAGLVLQRTYNSNEARVGPFGIGWTHAYDIRIQEAADVSKEDANTSIDTTTDDVPRTDFFGHKHTYHRDADGLYSPPPYLYDETNSDYNTALVNGPTQVMDDTEKGMDGTIKHYRNVVVNANGTSGNERACDYIQDRYGNKTMLTYGLSYKQADGSTRSVLTQVADPTGRTLTFQWTNFGTATSPAYRITEVDAPTDLTTGARTYRVTYAYYVGTEAASGGAAYQLKSVTLDPDGLNRTTTYTYTSFTGTYTDQNNNQQTTTEVGLLASISDPLGNTVSYAYATALADPDYPQDVMSSPTGSIWVRNVREPAGVDTTGAPRTITWNIGTAGANTQGGVAGVAFSTKCYNGDDIEVWDGVDPSLRSTDVAASFWSVYANAESPGAIFRDQYDNSNNVTVTTRYTIAAAYPSMVDQYTFGQHGNVLTHMSGYSTAQDVSAYYNATQYFQKQSTTDAASHTTTIGVGTNTAGNPGDPDSNIGDRGQTLWVQDAGYNDSSSPSYHKQFTYTYNQWGQKLSETNLNGVVTQYTYGTSGNDLGNLIQVVQDAGGTGHLNRITSMHYDVMGRVLSSTDPAGLTSTFSYNTLGQPGTVSTPVRSATPAEKITYQYDNNGRTHSVQDNHGTVTMTYEAGCDRVSSVIDTVTGTVGYTYMPSGERATLTLPDGKQWTYAYAYHTGTNQVYPNLPESGDILPKDDPDSTCLNLLSITDDQGRVVRYNDNTSLGGPSIQAPAAWYQDFGVISAATNNVTYDQSGNLVSYVESDSLYDLEQPPMVVPRRTHGWLAGASETFHYEALSNVTHSNVWQAKTLNNNAYTYDNGNYTIGLRTSNQVTDSTGAVRTENYTYDALNRLSTVDYGDGETQSYGFDPMGNRLTKTDTAGGTTTTNTYGYDAANRLTSAANNGASASAVTSDADGNTLTDTGERTMTWDSQNRMASCAFQGTTSTFTYGADGLRRSETVNGVTTYYVYDGQTLIREMHKNVQTGALYSTATYLTGPRGPEYRRDDTATELDSQGRQVSKCRWYVYDGLGSVVGEVDPSGNMTSSPKYDVYGGVRQNPGTASSAMGFCGGTGASVGSQHRADLHESAVL